MDLDTVTDFFSPVTDWYEREPVLAIAAVAGVAVLLLALVVFLVARRRTRRRTPTPPTEPESLQGTVRRVSYLDALLLDDLLAHAEPGDFGRGLRQVLETSEEVEGAHTAQVRKLNKVLAGLRERRLLVDCTGVDELSAGTGTPIVVRGELSELPATEIASLLELSAPLLVHAAPNGNPSSTGSSTGLEAGARPSPADDVPSQPLVMRLATGGSTFVLPLDREGVRRPLPDGSGPVTVLGVVDRAVGRRERLDPEEYLTNRLSPAVRDMLDDRDITEITRSVSRLARAELPKRGLHVDGPAAVLEVAAIYR